jgi:hypothetical protein
MMTSGEPGERRRAILQVMCRTNSHFRERGERRAR